MFKSGLKIKASLFKKIDFNKLLHNIGIQRISIHSKDNSYNVPYAELKVIADNKHWIHDLDEKDDEDLFNKDVDLSDQRKLQEKQIYSKLDEVQRFKEICTYFDKEEIKIAGKNYINKYINKKDDDKDDFDIP